MGATHRLNEKQIQSFLCCHGKNMDGEFCSGSQRETSALQDPTQKTGAEAECAAFGETRAQKLRRSD